MGLQSVGLSRFRKQTNTYTGQRDETVTALSIEEKIRPYIQPQGRSRRELLEAYYQAVSKFSAHLEERGISEDDIIADFQKARQRERLS